MKKHKVARFLMISIVLFVQVIFLLMIVKDEYNSDNYGVLFVIFFVMIILVLGYRYLDLHHEEYVYENISVVIWVPIGAVVCYLLNTSTNLGNVLSVGIVGTFAYFLPVIDKKSEYLSKLPSVIYCGAFIGMSSLAVAPSITFVALAGVLAGVFFMLSKNLIHKPLVEVSHSKIYKQFQSF